MTSNVDNPEVVRAVRYRRVIPTFRIIALGLLVAAAVVGVPWIGIERVMLLRDGKPLSVEQVKAVRDMSPHSCDISGDVGTTNSQGVVEFERWYLRSMIFESLAPVTLCIRLGSGWRPLWAARYRARDARDASLDIRCDVSKTPAMEAGWVYGACNHVR